MLSKSLTPGVAFITGGARGLGNAVAVSFAKAGAKGVVLMDIQGPEVLAEGAKNVESQGVACLTIRGDVSKEEDVQDALYEAVTKFGRIDYAANFAGIGGRSNLIVDGDTGDFQNVMDVNVTGSYLCTKYQMNQMLKQDTTTITEGRAPQRGSIVNCASVNSVLAAPYSISYTTSKHAVVGLTKVAALEGRRNNIRVNSVAPGFLYTAIVAESVERAGEAGQAKWREFEARQGRRATFDEIGDAVVLISTPGMSLLNGHNLVLDNGFTVNEMNT